MSFQLVQSCKLRKLTSLDNYDFHTYIQSQLYNILNTLRQESKLLRQKYENQIQNMKKESEKKDNIIATLTQQCRHLLQHKKQQKINKKQDNDRNEKQTQTLISISVNSVQQNKLIDSQNVKDHKIDPQKISNSSSNLMKMKYETYITDVYNQNTKQQHRELELKSNKFSKNKQITQQQKILRSFIETDNKQENIYHDGKKQSQTYITSQINLMQTYLVLASQKQPSSHVTNSQEKPLSFSNKKYQKNRQIKSQGFISSPIKTIIQQDLIYSPQDIQKSTKDQVKYQPKHEHKLIKTQFRKTEQKLMELNYFNLSFKKQKYKKSSKLQKHRNYDKKTMQNQRKNQINHCKHDSNYFKETLNINDTKNKQIMTTNSKSSIYLTNQQVQI